MRWPRPGAAEVIGIEARPELVARYRHFPETPYKARVDLRVGEVFEALESFVSEGEEFDVVALFGLFYHVMDHFRLLQLIRLAGARIVLIDSEFMLMNNPMIQLIFERTGSDLNAPEQIPGQERALIGVPSVRAMNAMARALDFDIVWSDAGRRFRQGSQGRAGLFPSRKEAPRGLLPDRARLSACRGGTNPAEYPQPVPPRLVSSHFSSQWIVVVARSGPPLPASSAWNSGTVVSMPSTINSPSARFSRASASGRSRPWTISLPIRLS